MPHNARKQQATPTADSSKWCGFHRNYGHTKEDCTILKDQIEYLVRQRLLDKYIAGEKEATARTRTQIRNNEEAVVEEDKLQR